MEPNSAREIILPYLDYFLMHSKRSSLMDLMIDGRAVQTMAEISFFNILVELKYSSSDSHPRIILGFPVTVFCG